MHTVLLPPHSRPAAVLRLALRSRKLRVGHAAAARSSLAAALATEIDTGTRQRLLAAVQKAAESEGAATAADARNLLREAGQLVGQSATSLVQEHPLAQK